jgi:hypothetical protein
LLRPSATRTGMGTHNCRINDEVFEVVRLAEMQNPPCLNHGECTVADYINFLTEPKPARDGGFYIDYKENTKAKKIIPKDQLSKSGALEKRAEKQPVGYFTSKVSLEKKRKKVDISQRPSVTTPSDDQRNE